MMYFTIVMIAGVPRSFHASHYVYIHPSTHIAVFHTSSIRLLCICGFYLIFISSSLLVTLTIDLYAFYLSPLHPLIMTNKPRTLPPSKDNMILTRGASRLADRSRINHSSLKGLTN